MIGVLNRSRWTSPIKYRLDAGDQSALEARGTLVLPMQRDRLLRYLPSHARIAEVGVARGHFSAELRAVVKPSFMALVDPWCQQEEAVYFGDTNNATQTEQDRRFADVTRKFASSRPGRECRVLRKFSADAVKEFEDGFFDWVFIDANHSYEACLEDLRLWAPKVAPDGLILGHDFAAHASARNAKYGVVEAVETFTRETGYLLAAITVEHFPTFVIAKNPAGDTLKRFRQLLFSFERFVIELPRGAATRLRHARILDNGQPRSAFMGFESADGAT